MNIRSLKSHHWVLGIGAVIMLLAVSMAGYFYMQNRKLTASARETEEVKAAVGRHFVIPNETPTVATVVDKAKLADQVFFAQTENGDKVLIFPEAKRAILYRPSTDKIIEVAPFVVPPVTEDNQLNPSSSPSSNNSASPLSTAVSVTILNGTAKTGLAAGFSNTVQSALPNSSITKTVEAKRKDYPKTLVIDVKNSKSNEVARLAQSLSAEVAPLPAGEDVPESDVVVIIGADKQ